MAQIYLHPACCQLDLVRRIQKQTGLVAAITGARVELVTPSRWTEQFCSSLIRSRMGANPGPGAA